MTINTTKDERSDAKSDVAVEPPATSKTQPGVGTPSEPSLESRIGVRRVEMVAKLRELREDIRIEAAEAGDKVKAKLSELSHLIKEGVVDGWGSISDKVKLKLEHWMAESSRQLAAQPGQAQPDQAQPDQAQPAQAKPVPAKAGQS